MLGLGRATGDLSKSLSLSCREPPLMTLSPWDCALSTGLPAVRFRTGRLSTPSLSTSWLTDLQGIRSNPTADSRLNVEPSHWKIERKEDALAIHVWLEETYHHYWMYKLFSTVFAWLALQMVLRLRPWHQAVKMIKRDLAISEKVFHL